MPESSPFLVRRVLAGVLVVAAVLALAFLGVVHWQKSRYHDREARVVGAYRTAYRSCLTTRFDTATCSSRAEKACVADHFWSQPAPFTLGLGGDIDEASLKCVFTG